MGIPGHDAILFNLLDSLECAVNTLNDLKELPLGYGSGFGSMSDVDFTEVAS